MRVKISGFILTILALGAIFVSCGKNNSANTSEFTKEIYAPEYAKGFTIKGADGKESVLIESNNPWQGADSVVTKLLIVRNGEEIPENFDGQILNGDAKKIVTLSSTHVAMLDAVNAADCVVGVSGIDYISNPTIVAKRDKIADIGYEGNVNYELLLSLEPDIVILYGVNGASLMENKLKELGIPFMYIGDYLEESPLGKAEWTVALSEVVGKRNEGQDFFKDIPARYNALKEKVEAQNYQSLPTIMVNAPFGDSWFMPSVNNYSVRLLEDAGGKYIYSRNKGDSSEPIDLEEAYNLVSQSDIWLNPGQAATMEDLKKACPKFIDVPSVKNGKVYNNNARTNEAGGNDYFESGVINPDILLRDLIKIFHPELIEEDLVYYRQLK